MAVIRKNRFAYFNWALCGVIFFLTAVGILLLYSATAGRGPFSGDIPLYGRQCIWIALSLALFAAILFIDYHRILSYSYLIYGLTLVMLIYVLLFGRSISGARRWIDVGPLQFQPSEFVKLTFILALARFFHNNTAQGGYTLRDVWLPLVCFAVTFVLVLLEPDLGTAMVLSLVFLSVILFMGIKRRYVILMAVVGLLSMPAGWHLLRDYQKERILTLLDPSRDPLGSGYHITQSKIAIGSGMVFGRGFLQGTQTRLRFLPEHHTDFIFSVLAEEWGFCGSVIVLLSYALLLFWGLEVARQAKDTFAMVTAVGVTCLLFWHVTINIGMGMGVLPVVGVPLPLLSYGGSFLLVTFVGLGLLLNIHMRRFMF